MHCRFDMVCVVVVQREGFIASVPVDSTSCTIVLIECIEYKLNNTI